MRRRPRSYEAFVIYNFLSLCLSYVGGPGAVEVQMNGYLLMPSWWNCTCCLPPQVRVAAVADPTRSILLPEQAT